MYVKMLISLLPLFFALNLLAQQPVKQITYYNSDVKNANYVKTSFLDSLLFYEVSSGDSVNIHCRLYEVFTDSFYIFPPVTDDQYKNINPLAINNYSFPVVFYQTNKNGNWDIVYRRYISGGWSEPSELLATAEDETEPKYVGTTEGSFDTLKLVCRQGNKILLLSFKDSLVSEETIFSGDIFGQNNYYTGFYHWYLQKPIRIAATEQTSYGSRIVYRYKIPNDTGWTLPVIIADSGNYARPLYFDFFGDAYLFYENEVNGVNQIFYKPGDIEEEQILDPEIQGSKSELGIAPIFAIVGEQRDDIYALRAYKLAYSDSILIRVPINESEYKTHPIKTIHPDPAISPLGFLIDYLVYYSIWQDSVNGTTQLFGQRALVLLGEVNDHSSIKAYSLYQNYPNPFNPLTTIKYSLPDANNVIIKIYDVLGNELMTLLNDYLPAGEYKIQFDGTGFASGVYILRLNSGSQSLSRKMLLMK